jgi:uncharacterized repeat protein (TIGR02543 family)
VVQLTANPDSGWEFAGWSGDLSGSTNPTKITMNGNRSVTATFEEIPEPPPDFPSSFYGTVLVNGSNVPDGTIISAWIGGVNCAETGTFTYEGESVYTIGVPPDNPNTTVIEGGVEGDTIVFHIGSGTADQTGTWHAGTNVELNLTATQYTLTVSVVGNGSVDLDPSGGTYNAGTVVQLTANPDSGWQFTDWSGDLSGSTNPTSITMNGNRSVTATFEPIPQYDLTVNIVGEGSVDLVPSGGTYYESTDVELTAVPDSGWIFSVWTGDLDGNANPETITMDDDKTVTATFVKTEINVDKTAEPTSLPEPGGTVTFTIRVDNMSTEIGVTIDSLVDNVHGDLNGQGDCSVPQMIAAGEYYECSFTAAVTGEAGYTEVDTVLASGEDVEGNPVGDDDDAEVTIIEQENNTPITVGDEYETYVDKTLEVPAPGLLENDQDVDGDQLYLIWASDPSHGKLTWNADGSFTYKPDDGYEGPDSFEYKASDGKAESNISTVSIDVLPDIPVISPNVYFFPVIHNEPIN